MAREIPVEDLMSLPCAGDELGRDRENYPDDFEPTPRNVCSECGATLVHNPDYEGVHMDGRERYDCPTEECWILGVNRRVDG